MAPRPPVACPDMIRERKVQVLETLLVITAHCFHFLDNAGQQWESVHDLRPVVLY